jgi:hypothetical protein
MLELIWQEDPHLEGYVATIGGLPILEVTGSDSTMFGYTVYEYDDLETPEDWEREKERLTKHYQDWLTKAGLGDIKSWGKIIERPAHNVLDTYGINKDSALHDRVYLLGRKLEKEQKSKAELVSRKDIWNCSKCGNSGHIKSIKCPECGLKFGHKADCHGKGINYDRLPVETCPCTADPLSIHSISKQASKK